MLPARMHLIEEANDDEMTVNTNKQFNPIFPVFDKTRLSHRINYERIHQRVGGIEVFELQQTLANFSLLNTAKSRLDIY